MTAERSGGRKGAKRAQPKTDGAENELLRLAQSIVDVARTEIVARQEALERRSGGIRSILAQVEDAADDREHLEAAYRQLDTDGSAAVEAVKAKTLLLDDLAHDPAAVVARFQGIRHGAQAEHDES